MTAENGSGLSGSYRASYAILERSRVEPLDSEVIELERPAVRQFGYALALDAFVGVQQLLTSKAP